MANFLSEGTPNFSLAAAFRLLNQASGKNNSPSIPIQVSPLTKATNVPTWLVSTLPKRSWCGRPRADTVSGSLLIGTFIQQQITAILKLRSFCDLLAHLAQNSLRRPRRIAHQMINALLRSFSRALDVGKVSFLIHSPQSTHIVKSLGTCVARASLETIPITLVKLMQPVPWTTNGLRWQSPSLGAKKIPFLCLARSLLTSRNAILFFNISLTLSNCQPLFEM